MASLIYRSAPFDPNVGLGALVTDISHKQISQGLQCRQLASLKVPALTLFAAVHGRIMAYKRTRKEFEADLQAQQSPFVFYGTALPPLDPAVRDDGSYVPVWKQEVTDERGRKRLHGAFTGGFSAG